MCAAHETRRHPPVGKDGNETFQNKKEGCFGWQLSSKALNFSRSTAAATKGSPRLRTTQNPLAIGMTEFKM